MWKYHLAIAIWHLGLKRWGAALMLQYLKEQAMKFTKEV